MSTTIDWYFDFISPFAYLQQARFSHFPNEIKIKPKPVLFAGLLNHWEHKGPAEIAAKRIFTYQHAVWLGKKMNIPLNMPPAHPFNPLKALRLTIALENDMTLIGQIFNYIWKEGLSIDDEDSWNTFISDLNIKNAEKLSTQDEVKNTLRLNTEDAINAGVFGVPTIIANGHLFWGVDATDMYLEYWKNPNFFDEEQMKKIDKLPQAARR
jgi:2-hydroxychromene-2-carboxylate isomerase